MDTFCKECWLKLFFVLRLISFRFNPIPTKLLNDVNHWWWATMTNFTLKNNLPPPKGKMKSLWILRSKEIINLECWINQNQVSILRNYSHFWNYGIIPCRLVAERISNTKKVAQCWNAVMKSKFGISKKKTSEQKSKF